MWDDTKSPTLKLSKQVYYFYAKLIYVLPTGSDGHNGATRAATFSVAVAAAPLLFFVTSDKRQRRCFF